MHVVREKASGKILYIDYAPTTAPMAGKKVYAQFNEDFMEIGWTPKSHIPAHFSIDHDGNVVEFTREQRIEAGYLQLSPDQKLVGGMIVRKSIAELVAGGVLQLEELKQQMIARYSELSLEKRARLVPDYKLQNAALGLYDEDTVSDCRATVKAFRDEFYRVKGEIERASTADAVESVKPQFPEAVVRGTRNANS